MSGTDDGGSESADRRQLWTLYLARFARSFGFITLVTLLPEFIDLYNAEGAIVGLFITGMTLAQFVAVLPLAWAGDRYDKRTVLLAGLSVSVLAYTTFGLVTSAAGFIAARALQGLALTASGLMTLALVGELSAPDERANNIGKANSARFAAGIGGSLSAGALYTVGGTSAVFGTIVFLVGAALLGVWAFIDPDETTVSGFAIRDLAVNRRILTMTSFRAQYAVAVSLVRNWVPIFAGVAAAKGGLAFAPLAVGVVVTAEKFTNMLCQPFTGRLSDRFGRARFVAFGGASYGLVALVVPATPAVGAALSLPATFPVVGTLSPAFLPLVALNGLLGVADSFREPASMALFADEGTEDGGVASSFGIRSIVWRPGSILAPIAGGFLMDEVSMASVFLLGGAAALTGVVAFLALLTYAHGRSALAEW